MSYRAEILSPLPTYGLGTMPGSSNVTTYSSSYRRGGSGTRNYDTIGGSSTLYNRTHRPLPSGPGPLDHRGKKLNSYTASDIRKNSSSTTTSRGPLRADHSTHMTSRYDHSDYTPSVGTLPRKYSSSNVSAALIHTTKDTSLGSRSIRSRSVSNTDRITDNLSHVKLNGYDGTKASPRITDSDDSLSGVRESRRDRHDNLNDINNRSGSRFSRTSNTSVLSNNDENSILNMKNRDNTGRSSSIQKDTDIKRRDSITDIGNSKSLSRQSSSSSITVSSSKYAYGGKSGLRNIGNTCFMNSVLQCLSNTRPLLEYILKEDFVLDINNTTSKLKGALMKAYASLIISFWKDKSGSYVTPNNFKSQIQRFAPRFSGYQQQDSQEFLRYLLEGLHEDVNRVTQKPKHLQIDDDKFKTDVEKASEYWKNYLRYDNSKIVEIFVGQLKSELKFEECNHHSVTFDPFWDLSLPVPKLKSECDIVDCLGLFMKEEVLEGDESPTCTKCKKRRSCTKRFSIQKFPPILVLHLKRFSQERYSRKITTLVNFPVKTLDLREFAAEKGQQTVYNLYAVSEHSGTTYGGHYTAKCKHPYTGEWHSFNDTHVSSCGANQAVSSEAYVLFYELAGNNSPSML